MIVTFWSPIHGQANTTSNALIIAIYSVIQCKKKMLVINADCRGSMEQSLFRQVDNNIYDNIGMDALLRYAKIGRYDEPLIRDISISFMREMLHIISSTNKNNKEFEINLLNTKVDIFIQISKYYDYIFIDLPNGVNQVSKYFLKISNLNIINLSQNKHLINDFLELSMDEFHLEYKANYIYLMGAYQKASCYNLINLQKVFPQLSKKIAAIPYNIEVLDAISNSKLISYMQSLNLLEGDCNNEFIFEIKSVCDLISIYAKEG